MPQASPTADLPILLLTPPLVDSNTPYPATPYLTGFLRARGHDVRQADLSLELLLRLFSRDGLRRLHEVVRHRADVDGADADPVLAHFLDQYPRYAATVEPVVAFLQGRNPTLARRLAARRCVPEGPAFAGLLRMPLLQRRLAEEGEVERARFVAAFYLRDLVGVVQAAVDPEFGLAAYGERLAASRNDFDALAERLAAPPNLIDELLGEILDALIADRSPRLVGITVPFPGNVYGALRSAALIKARLADCTVVLGGGYVNTELRMLSDVRVFAAVDYITLDDGERPLECLIEHRRGERPADRLLRTLRRDGDRVLRVDAPDEADPPFAERPTPTYAGLDLDRYLPIPDTINPMLRVSFDHHWNKLTLAHGCYWKKCSFCDLALDYIDRYSPDDADRLVERIVALVAETGRNGFHFVDEAAPPKLLAALSRRLVERGVDISWWGNIRFEKTFTPALTQAMADAGCIAVTGGLEVASDRLLRLMNKGVDIAQVARVTRAFADAGIMAHAYLMYGFPSQTVQETVDSLEVVRQLFAAGCLKSANWHRFGATVHSPIGRDPKAFGIRLKPLPAAGQPVFAVNTIGHEDSVDCPHDRLAPGLRAALHHYLLGRQFERPVEAWFDFDVPPTTVDPGLIDGVLASDTAASRAPAF